MRARNMCGQGCQTMFKIECNLAVRCFAPVINEGSVPAFVILHILHVFLDLARWPSVCWKGSLVHYGLFGVASAKGNLFGIQVFQA